MKTSFILSALVAAISAGPSVLAPRCSANEASCSYGDDCCSGLCMPNTSNQLTCAGLGVHCVAEGETCLSTTDCCSGTCNGTCQS